MQKKNLALDTSYNFTLTKDTFDIGILFLYNGENDQARKNIDQYFSFGLYTIDYEVITDPEEIKQAGNSYYWR
jgi:hypothetical protein